MLASRATCRAVAGRRSATAVDVAGLRIAAVDHGQPSSSITVLVKAGTRHEPKSGLAHLLKNYAFKNTADKSALRIARETELYGGVLSSSLGREHLALTAEFLKGDEAYFVDLLASLLLQTRYTPHELHESVIPSAIAEATEASHDATLTALDVAHALAFRTGLGASLFHGAETIHATPEDVKAFASSVFSKSNVSVFGSGIDSNLLSKLVEKAFAALPSADAGTSNSAKATKYFGGDSRVSLPHGPQTIFIGYGSASATTPDLQVLSAHLSANPHIKWSEGTTSPFGTLPAGVKVQNVLLPYSDATLFGFLVQAPTTEGVHAGGKAVVSALKGASASLKAETLKPAIAKAKFNAASALESRQGQIEFVSQQLLTGAPKASIESTFASFNKVSASSLSSAASQLIKSKPVYVAVGDVHGLPYADEIGL